MPALGVLACGRSLVQTAPVARSRRCRLCGRDLTEVPEPVQVGEMSFCSHGHYLEYEARPTRVNAQVRPRVLASVLAAIVLAAILFAYLGRSQRAHSSFLTQGVWAEPSVLLPSGGGITPSLPDVNGFTQTPPTPQRVHVPAAGLEVAKRFLSALYVQRSCRTATALAAPSATAFVSGCAAQLEAIKQVDFRLVRGSVHIDTACGQVPGLLWSTQCVAYEEEGVSRSRAGSTADASALLERLVVYVWPDGKRWVVVGTGLRSEHEGPETETLKRLWKRTATPALS